MLKLFNTLTKKIEEFKPIKKGEVRMYSCGPTVYNFIHLGNARAYVVSDLLKRYLKYLGLQVKHVMNITDVDDKTIRDSQKAKKTLKEFTDFYLKSFLEDLEALNIEMPDFMPKATKHIKEMVNLVKKIEKRGYAYRINNSIYFKISKFKNYGQLAQLEQQSLKLNASKRLNIKDEYEKENVNDFVLWKAWDQADDEVFWETAIGKGRPGWHIECSAMSMKYLGEHFDIHTGGVDLIFPHHTNEIAQSETATGKKFVNYWLHNAHLVVNGQKMSKSQGNFYTLKDLKEKKYKPLFLRIILLKTHYRQILNFTFKEFEEARAIALRLINFLINLDFVQREKRPSSSPDPRSGHYGAGNDLKIDHLIESYRKNFKKAMDNDLNISEAFSIVFDLVNGINKSMTFLTVDQARKIKDFIFEIDKVFGFIEKLYNEYNSLLEEKIEDKRIRPLLEEREKARKQKDFQKADFLRQKIAAQGLLIEDLKEGFLLKVKDLYY